MPGPARDDAHETPVRQGKGVIPAGFHKRVLAVLASPPYPFTATITAAGKTVTVSGPGVAVLPEPLDLVALSEVEVTVDFVSPLGAVTYAGLLGPLEINLPAQE